MPISEEHHTKRKKNLILLAILVAFILIMFAITILKMS